MWAAGAAVAAVWLWRSGRLPAVGKLPAGAVAAALVAACVVDQSHGAILLMALALAGVWLAGARPAWLGARPVLAVWAIGLMVLFVSGTALVALRGGPGGARGAVRDTFAGAGKTSFTWRLARSEDLLPRVAEAPILGHARADWSPRPGHTFVNPVNLGLWVLVLGMYGAAGLAALALLLALPVAEAVKWLPPRAWLNPGCSGVTLAAVLLVLNTLDAALNSTFLLPLLAGGGGLVSWSLRRYEGA
jgi:hypothetical protein